MASKEISQRANVSATDKINTSNLLDQLMTLARSNMSGDGEYTDKQIANQAKLTAVAIRLVELELKINKAFAPNSARAPQ